MNLGDSGGMAASDEGVVERRRVCVAERHRGGLARL